MDYYVEHPVALMAVVPGDTYKPPLWKAYRAIVRRHDKRPFEYVPRFDFYDRAKKAYAIVATGEKARYANVILKKGVVVE